MILIYAILLLSGFIDTLYTLFFNCLVVLPAFISIFRYHWHWHWYWSCCFRRDITNAHFSGCFKAATGIFLGHACPASFFGRPSPWAVDDLIISSSIVFDMQEQRAFLIWSLKVAHIAVGVGRSMMLLHCCAWHTEVIISGESWRRTAWAYIISFCYFHLDDYTLPPRCSFHFITRPHHHFSRFNARHAWISLVSFAPLVAWCFCRLIFQHIFSRADIYDVDWSYTWYFPDILPFRIPAAHTAPYDAGFTLRQGWAMLISSFHFLLFSEIFHERHFLLLLWVASF